jgi:hypothetical protein
LLDEVKAKIYTVMQSFFLGNEQPPADLIYKFITVKHFLFMQMCTQKLSEVGHRRRFGAPSKRHIGKARSGL